MAAYQNDATAEKQESVMETLRRIENYLNNAHGRVSDILPREGGPSTDGPAPEYDSVLPLVRSCAALAEALVPKLDRIQGLVGRL